MTLHIGQMSADEAARVATRADERGGLGALHTERGNLPLAAVDVHADIAGLAARVRLTQEFVNGYDIPLEATYVFPMPDRAAVTAMTMTADDRVIEAKLAEREAARRRYDEAVAAGQRASIAEEERPDVFTMRVGNILPGERVSVALTMACPLSYADGAATFRFPLVVAPRYIPGAPLPGPATGAGYAGDTDAVPDASRITPPILLPGFPNPVRLSIDVGVDPGGLPVADARATLPVESTVDGRYQVRPGARLDRDFVLRLGYDAAASAEALLLQPDGEGEEGTYQLTVLPPSGEAPPRPRDVVLVLDRSGSMQGWKMVAARRAAARIVDTLTPADRFAVLTFDDRVERPDLPAGLVAGTDRHRYRAVEHLARADARGGTELLTPLREALSLLTTGGADGHEAVLVLVTDGQVGNEDQIIHELAGELGRVRVHTVGIDQAVNAGFLGRLAAAGGGRCELVESEDRLDDAMDAIHRRIGAPLVTGIRLEAAGLTPIDGTRAPDRVPDLFPGVPLVVAGRYTGGADGSVAVHGSTRDGRPWSTTATARPAGGSGAVTELWARAHLRDLEDRYLAAPQASAELERRIVQTSLRFGVLCRFTAYVAVDSRVVAEAGRPHQVVQPVELPAGWAMPAPRLAGSAVMMARHMAAPATALSGARAMFMARDVDAAVPPLAQARDQVTAELARLRAGRVGLPGYERRELLADLATRLRALLAFLRGRGVDDALTRPVRELVEAIEAGGDVDALWDRAVSALEDFLTGKAPRRAFWKRT